MLYQKLVFVLGLSSIATTTQWQFSNNLKFIAEEKWHLQNENITLRYNQSLILKRENEVKYYPIYLNWVKILPAGFTSNINQSEINHYKSIINNLLQQDIEPVVTLFSGNLPPMFSPLGGWTNPNMVAYFKHYARQAFKIFGDTIRVWITFHEPRKICKYFQNLMGNELPLRWGEYLCAHNILKAHAETYHMYNKEFKVIQKGKISITFGAEWVQPENPTNHLDILAAEQKMHFEFGLYAHPILNFGYPATVINWVSERSKIEGFSKSCLPEFTYLEKLKISQTCDFLQIQYTDALYIQRKINDKTENLTLKTDLNNQNKPNCMHEEKRENPTSQSSFRKLIYWITNNYQIPDIMVQNDIYYKVTADDFYVL